MAHLDALLGKIRSRGVEVELAGGINFASGIEATLNPTTNVVDVRVANPYAATSTTENTIGLGELTWSTQSGLSYQLGTQIKVADAADPATNYVIGIVTEYDLNADFPNPTDLTLDVHTVAGAGTIAAWVLGLAGDRGPQGEGLEIDASGTFAERDAFDDEAAGFVYLSTDGDGTPGSNALLYVMGDGGSADWDGGLPFQGDDGVSAGVLYTYSSNTTMADPTPGILRFDNAAPASATAMCLDDLDANGHNLETYLLAQFASTNTVKGYVLATNLYTGAIAILAITGGTDSSGFVQLALSSGAGSGTWTDGDAVSVQFYRTGDASPAASTTVAGIAELATTTETITGIDATRTVTPDGLAALWEAGADITDGAAITIGEGGIFNLITSTTAITSFVFATSKVGRVVRVRFATARTLTHNASSLIVAQGAASITTVAGDTCEVEDLGSGNVRVRNYCRSASLPAPIASPTFTGTVTLPTGLTGVLRADSGVVSVDTDVTDIVAAASDSAAGKIEIAIQSEMETGTDTTRAVTPGRQHFHPSAAKFWVRANGSGGIVGTAYNVASLVDDGPGLVTVTIATDFSSGSWVWFASVENNDATIDAVTDGIYSMAANVAIAAGTIQFISKLETGTAAADPTSWALGGFGDQ